MVKEIEILNLKREGGLKFFVKILLLVTVTSILVYALKNPIIKQLLSYIYVIIFLVDIVLFCFHI